MWAGPRGGAAFTAACLVLAARTRRPVWPVARAGPGLLVEAFPAAQLRQWELPYQRYDGKAGTPVRAGLVERLRLRVDPAAFASAMRDPPTRSTRSSPRSARSLSRRSGSRTSRHRASRRRAGSRCIAEGRPALPRRYSELSPADQLRLEKGELVRSATAPEVMVFQEADEPP